MMVAEIYRTSETCCIFCWPTAVSEMGELFAALSGCLPSPTFEPHSSEGLVVTASVSRSPLVSRNLGSATPRKKRDVECSLHEGLPLRFIALATSLLRRLTLEMLSGDDCVAFPTCVDRFTSKSSLWTRGKGEDETLACQFSTRSQISRRSNTGTGGRG